MTLAQFTQWKANLLERILTPLDARKIEGEQLQLALLTDISQQLAALNTRLGAAPASGGGVSGPPSGLSSLLLTLSVDPDILHRFILAASDRTSGLAYSNLYQFPVVATANQVTTLGLALPTGQVAMLAAPAEIQSELESANIAVDYLVDGKSVIGQLGVYLGPPMPVHGEWQAAVDTGSVFEFTNTTTTDVVVYVTAQIFFMTNTFYTNTWKPILARALKSLESGATAGA